MARKLTESRRRQLQARLEELITEARELCRDLDRPHLIVPHYDTDLDKKLHDNGGVCPYCCAADVNASDYDGDHDLSVKVNCDACGAEWVELYRFVGAVPA